MGDILSPGGSGVHGIYWKLRPYAAGRRGSVTRAVEPKADRCVQIRLRFRFGFGGPSMRRWSSRGMGGLLLFAAGRGGGGSLIPV